ncbi:hypothetical protein D9M69_541740 [compost metagenome]
MKDRIVELFRPRFAQFMLLIPFVRQDAADNYSDGGHPLRVRCLRREVVGTSLKLLRGLLRMLIAQ